MSFDMYGRGIHEFSVLMVAALRLFLHVFQASYTCVCRAYFALRPDTIIITDGKNNISDQTE